LACRSPADCFYAVIEAWRIAVRFMTPVVLLSDGYIANGAEPWRVPRFEDLPKIPVEHPAPTSEREPFLPYLRDERLSRPWALPGTAGLQHRIGGLEKQHVTGNVCYDPDNHEFMIKLRAQKVENIAMDIPLQEVQGSPAGELLVLSWGGTYGACVTAVQQCQDAGLSVAHAHLRYLNPFPANLGEVLGNYRRILIPEWNMGQLKSLIRDKYLVDAQGLNKVKGKPFSIEEIVAAIRESLA
jgi:2-oxoglutarate ferredoxin oxidoreductase subunit alpha